MLIGASGETHRRQRKVMLPAFGSPEAKALLPIFEHYAEQVCRILHIRSTPRLSNFAIR